MIIWNFYHFVALPAGCWLCGGSPYGVDQFVGQIYSERFHASRGMKHTLSSLQLAE
jgi:dimethylaniline monooxygenase (N-oxide forming)